MAEFVSREELLAIKRAIRTEIKELVGEEIEKLNDSIESLNVLIRGNGDENQIGLRARVIIMEKAMKTAGFARESLIQSATKIAIQVIATAGTVYIAIAASR
jgi:hypothetical protein